jgi:hypothetical protein
MARYRNAAEAIDQALRPRGPFPSMGSGSTSNAELQYLDSIQQQPSPRPPPSGSGSGVTSDMELRAYQRYMDTMRKLQQAETGQDFSSWGPGAAGDRRASQRAAQEFAAWDEGAIDRQAAQAGAQEFAAFDPRIADRQAAQGAAREFSSWSPGLESRATAPVIRFLEALGVKLQ